MNRLQVNLTSEQYEFLKTEAFAANKSMAAVLRNILDEVIEQREQGLLNEDPIWEMIGVGADIEGPTDISQNVDKYLYGERVSEPQLTVIRKVAEEPNEYHPD